MQGTQTTFQAGDTIIASGNNTTLKLVDSGTTAWSLPAATVTGVKNILVQNNNGNAVGAAEVDTITLGALQAGQYLSFAGQTVLATAALTASQVASALLGTTVSGATLSGTLDAAYTKAAAVNSNQLIYTAKAVGNLADLVVSGNVTSTISQVNVISILTSTLLTTTTYTISINGVLVPVAAVASANSASQLATNIATAINTYAGTRIATAAGDGTVQVVSPSTINIGAIVPSTGAVAYTNALAPSAQTFDVTTAPTALATVSFTINGTRVTTAATAGTAATTNTATVIADAINTYYGATIATVTTDGTVLDVVTINSGAVGLAIGGFTATAGTIAGTAGVVTTSSGYSATSAPSVAIVNGIAAGGFTDIVDANNFVGATVLGTSQSTAAVTINNLAQGQAVTMNAGSGALTATYKSSATSATLNVTGGNTAGAASITEGALLTGVTVTSSGGAQTSAAGNLNVISSLGLGASVNTLTINAATSLNTNNITATGLKTINVSGLATTVQLNATNGTPNATVTTINGSGLTAGGIIATLTSAVTSFIGGAGTDTVTTGGTTNADAVINGGGGTADVLVLAPTYDVTTAAKAAQYINFEVIRNAPVASNSTSASETVRNVDMSLFGSYTSVQAGAGARVVSGTTYTDGAGFTNMNATQAAAITNRGDNKGATFSLLNSSGTADVLTVTLNNGTATTGPALSASLTGITVDGFETMNVISRSGVTSAQSSLGFTSASTLTALNLSGAAPLTVATGNLSLAVTIDASAMTFAPAAGAYTLTLSGNLVKGSSVVGTNLADSITTTTQVVGATGDFVTYNLGSGDDAISSTLAAINNTDATKASIKILGGSGVDTLTLTGTGAATIVDASFQYLTGIDAIGYAGGNNAISITSGGFFNTNFAGNSVTTITLGVDANAAANIVDLSTFTGNTTLSLNATSATTAAQTVSLGSGNDIVTLLVVGETVGSVVNLGGGNDSLAITVKNASITTAHSINGGAGQDSITLTGATSQATLGSVKYVVNAGQSTTTAYDSLTGAALNANSGSKFGTLFDFDGTAAIAGDMGATASVVSGVNYAISSGLLSFSGTGSTTLTLAQKIQIAVAAVTVDNATVVFTNNSDSFVYHNGVNATVIDDLVQLVGVNASGAQLASVTTFTDNFVSIA